MNQNRQPEDSLTLVSWIQGLIQLGHALHQAILEDDWKSLEKALDQRERWLSLAPMVEGAFLYPRKGDPDRDPVEGVLATLERQEQANLHLLRERLEQVQEQWVHLRRQRRFLRTYRQETPRSRGRLDFQA